MNRLSCLVIFFSVISMTGCSDLWDKLSEKGKNETGNLADANDVAHGFVGDDKADVSPSLSLAQLRDPLVDGYKAPCRDRENCPTYDLNEMVVVSETFVVSEDKDTKKPKMFGFFIADPKMVDGNGRLKPYSGIQVVISLPTKEMDKLEYTFGRQEDGSFAKPSDVGFEGFPRVGEIINIRGASKDYFGMPQLAEIKSIEKAGSTHDTDTKIKMPLPALFDGKADNTAGNFPSALKGGRPESTVVDKKIEKIEAATGIEKWVGVLVQLSNVQTTVSCFPQAFPSKKPELLRDFGNFLVTGDVEIGTLFGSLMGGTWLAVKNVKEQTCENTANKCEDSRILGQEFSSLIGIMDFSYGVYRLNPRSIDDIQPSSVLVGKGTGNCGQTVDPTIPPSTEAETPAEKTVAPTHIESLRDPSNREYVIPCSVDAATCLLVGLDRVVVTSPAVVLKRDRNRKPTSYGFFTADPAAVDEEGRLKPYSGIMVVVDPGSTGLLKNDYTFAKSSLDVFGEPSNTQDFPQVGDVVRIEGESRLVLNMPQVTNLLSLEKLGGVDENQLAMPKGALFDGAYPDFDIASPYSLRSGRVSAQVGAVTVEQQIAGLLAQGYVGVLVELQNVKMAETCSAQPYPFKSPTQFRDFGNFKVTGDIEIGTLFGGFMSGRWDMVREAKQQTCENRQNKCEDSRKEDLVFDSVQGIFDYSYGVYRLNPRMKEDYAPQGVFVAPGTGNCKQTRGRETP